VKETLGSVNVPVLRKRPGDPVDVVIADDEVCAWLRARGCSGAQGQ